MGLEGLTRRPEGRPARRARPPRPSRADERAVSQGYFPSEPQTIAGDGTRAANVACEQRAAQSVGSGSIPCARMPVSTASTTVSITATRAKPFDSAGISRHGAAGWSVRAIIASTATS